MSQIQESIFRNSAVASGLVTPSQLDYTSRLARHRLNSDGKALDTPIPDALLADILVEQNSLSRYQADQLCAGRTKLTLGPYLITDWIGQGGMGHVFKAVHQFMGRVCAVKVLPRASTTEESRISFIREIRMQAKLDCEYLVRAYDAGQDGSVHYLVTEYVPGMDLRRLVKAHGALPLYQAASIVRQAALGLDYAHRMGLVHRDVKPGNILVTPDGMAKVSDVGLAGFVADLSDDPRAGKIVGTADYLSPEQIRTPLDVGPVSDIYSLGCTLYYAICGKVPFPGGDSNSKLKRHLEHIPWHPRKFAPTLNEEFVDIVADMMEKDPQQRVQSAAEVAARLEPWSGDAGALTSARLSRGPWLALPPPSSELDGLAAAEAVLETVQLSQDTSQADSVSADSAASKVARSESMTSLSESKSQGPMELGWPDNRRSQQGQPASGDGNVLPTAPGSSSMLIATTIAIILPPALFIGAILGYLAHQWLKP